MVYDVSISDTFKKVKKWATELRTFNSNTVIVIAGNKVDLKIFDINKEDALEYSESINAKHFYTSAKTGEGLDEVFSSLGNELSQIVLKDKSKKELKRLQINNKNSVSKKKCCLII